jgi:hypothetical protein
VRLYRLRWRIEEVFRALKSDGMRLEETQMHEAGRLFKLAVVGLAAACQWRREIPQNRRAEIPHFILIRSRPNPLGGLISARVSRSRSIIS